LEARRRNKEIEKQGLADYKLEKERIKLLLLGAGESGKTTVLKQMKLLYGKGFENPGAEKGAFLTNIVTSMRELVDGTDRFVPLADSGLKGARNTIEQASDSMSGEIEFTDDIKDALIALWNDEGLRETWEKHRNELQVQEHLAYFMEKLEEFFEKTYIPTEDDWLRNRIRTTGVVRESFVLDGVEFEIWDVGGQRNERRKWIHVFDNVQALIFFAAINEYDQRLFESNDVNRIDEALNLFENVANNEAFDKAGLILFLNKSDLFAEKLNRSPIKYVDSENPKNSRFEDFKGPYCPMGEPRDSKVWKEAHDAGIEYFESRFVQRNHKPSTKSIYTHVTNAMDKNNIDFVFGACKSIILENMLKHVGLMRG